MTLMSHLLKGRLAHKLDYCNPKLKRSSLCHVGECSQVCIITTMVHFGSYEISYRINNTEGTVMNIAEAKGTSCVVAVMEQVLWVDS